MFIIERNKYPFKAKEIWFSDYPYEVKGVHCVMFCDCKQKADLKGFRRQQMSTLTIDLQREVELILSEISKSSRKAIKHAQRAGVVIERNRHYEEFFAINKEFRRDKGTEVTIANVPFLQKNGTLFVARYQGEVLCGRFFLEDESIIRSALGVSKRLQADKEKARLIANANRLMLWEAILYAKAKGLKEFDLGGVYKGEENDEQKERINVFKESFGGQRADRYYYEKYYSPLYRISKQIYMNVKKRIR